MHDPSQDAQHPQPAASELQRAADFVAAEQQAVDTQMSQPNWRRPLVLFLLTCASTYYVGQLDGGWVDGLTYSAALMGILLCHEFGHFLQAVRYRVPASLPYFIPIPVPPLGTMGAVIAMRGGMGNRRALFDIGITGPLAGLVPALACSIVGLYLSEPPQHELIVRAKEFASGSPQTMIGAPPLFFFLVHWIVGPIPPHHVLTLSPLAFAGWVGIFITALNLIPIGQLDGGHVLYALLRRKAHFVANALLMAAVVGVILTGNWGWSLMLILLFLIGPEHPPTADDSVPLGTRRTILGWLTLAFVLIGFTPTPFM